MFEDILLEYKNNIAYISINRPEKMNAIRIQTYQDITLALAQADQTEDCRVIIITGANGKFTAGNDLSDLVSGKTRQVMTCVENIFNQINATKKPIIAAVEGVAVGIGSTLLLHCDLVVSTAKTRFRLPFTNLGVSPEGASSVLLPKAIGVKMANELLLTGRFFSGEEALRWSLVNQLTDAGNTLKIAEDYAETILKQPFNALLATKAIIKQNNADDIEALVTTELSIFKTLLEMEETQQRIRSLAGE